MEKISVTYNVYSFDELSDKAKEKAANECVKWMMNICHSEDEMFTNIIKAGEEAESMQTPWFWGEIYYHDYNGMEEVENILKEFKFHEDGTIFSEKNKE